MSIAVVDIDSVIFTAFHPNKVLDEFGIPLKDNNKFVYVEKTEQECKDSCDSLMHMILTNSNADSYIGYVKGKLTTVSRLSINPDYKKNRGTDPPKYWKLCKDYFIENWGIIEANGYEVDDYVNAVRLIVPNSYIVAIDKDLLGLRTTDMNHYNWRRNEWVEVDRYDAAEKFWSDMVCGQPGDGITGLPGKGPAFFKKLIGGKVLNLHGLVLDAYITHYKDEDLGIREFYKTYNSLKILDKIEGLVMPTPIEYVKIRKENSKFEIDF